MSPITERPRHETPQPTPTPEAIDSHDIASPIRDQSQSHAATARPSDVPALP